jgi:von Willebrand factor type A domain
MSSLGHQIQEFFLSLVSVIAAPANEFRDPWFLLLLLLLPAYLVWYTFYYHPRRLMVRLSYDPEKVSRGTWMNVFRFLPVTLQSVGWILLSMETPDMGDTNRIAAAKQVAMKFIQSRQNDRIGMVLFAAGAYSYAPLTLDYNLLEKLIRPINTSMMRKAGTAIGTAIGIGIHRLENSPSPSKVMILITDGASNYGELPPITTAEIAAEKRIKIYTVAIGQAEFEGKQNDFDEPTLQKIASLTGGQFFRSVNSDGFEEAMRTISGMEKTEFKEDVIRELSDVYPMLVLVGVLLWIASFLFSVTFLHNPFEG